jgi:hypothetical protein
MITQERLKQLITYNKQTGIFIWKYRSENEFCSNPAYKKWNTRFANKEAGGIAGRGYWYIKVEKTQQRAHRLAWLYIYGEFPIYELDHIDGNKLNNKIDNLRISSRSQNMQNKRKTSASNSLVILGVRKTPSGKYSSCIGFNKKYKYLGTYETPDEAFNAYVEEKRKIHEFCTI